ncbi:apolipoprotein N-acyltransferase [Vreelandella aquamarina]
MHTGFSPSLGWQLVSAALAGGLTTLTASPFEFWWLGPIAAALVYLGTHSLTAPQAALKGLCYGLALFASGASWVYVSIHDYGNTGPLLAGLLTALFVFVLSLFFAATLWAYRRFTSPSLSLLSFAGVWVLGEVLRSYLFTGFPWLLLGTGAVDSPLAPWAPIGGVYLLSLLVAFSGTLLVALIQRRWWVTLPLAAIWLVPAVLPNQWTTPSTNPTQVAMVQGNLPQLIKWTAEGQRSAVGTYVEQTQALSDDTDLIIWPETALPMLEHQARPVLERLQSNLPAETALITGILQRDEREERYFNGMIGVGNVEGDYQKEHLVPFGEYLPLESVLRGLINFFDLPTSFITPGSSQQSPMQAAGITLGNAICYEIIYPQLVASRARHGQAIVTISNDTWFGRSIGPHQHLQMARLRALENGRYVLRATSNGITAIIDSQGNITQRVPQFETTTLNGEFYAMEGLTPFTQMGSWPTWILASLLVLPSLRLRKKPQA